MAERAKPLRFTFRPTRLWRPRQAYASPQANSSTRPPYEQHQQPPYVSPDTTCYNCNELCHISPFCPIQNVEGNVCTFPIYVHSVGNPNMMALAILPICLREIAISLLQGPIAVNEPPLIDDLEDQATMVCAVRRCNQNWKAP